MLSCGGLTVVFSALLLWRHGSKTTSAYENQTRPGISAVVAVTDSSREYRPKQLDFLGGVLGAESRHAVSAELSRSPISDIIPSWASQFLVRERF